MLHTAAAALGERMTGLAPPTHVRCRARTWRVLDARRVGAVTEWRLARDAEMPRLIVSPPDDVREMPGGERKVRRRAWGRAALAHARSEVPVWWPATAAGLPVATLPWQCVPAMMILSGHHRRVLLADEVGMGKTVQAGLLLHEVHAREPDAATLVITPPGLVRQWCDELRTRAHLCPAVLDAVALRREAAQPRLIVDASRAGACWVMSIDLLRQPDVVSLLARTRWTLLVVDEAHGAAPGSARLAAVDRVARASVRLLLLTATPTAAGVAAADALRCLGGTPGEKPMPVVRRRAALLERPPRRVRVLQATLGGSHAALCARLDRFVERARRESGSRGLLPALVLRRRASSCPAALLRSLERRLVVLGERGPEPPAISLGLFDGEPPPDQDAQDDEVMRWGAWADDNAEREELEELVRLVRRLPPGGRKLDCVARFVRRCRQPVVVFTTFVDSLRAIRPLLQDHRVVVVHGQQPEALRAEAIEAFTAGDASVLLATDAAAEGLNLQARCRLVIHAEVPWSARVLEQRIGRLDRHGQGRRVHAVVMASQTREDAEALERLRARAEIDEAWMAGVEGTRRCRRGVVAGRRAPAPGSACVAEARPDQAAATRDDTTSVVGTCTLPPRRWRRFADRLGLPTGTVCLLTATIRVAGGPELSASRVPIAIAASRALAPASIVEAARAHPALHAHVVRARRLARRLERWERAASIAASREAALADRPADLFADASPGPAPDGGDRQGSPVWVAMDAVSVISRGGVRP